jgi:PilZ domain
MDGPDPSRRRFPRLPSRCRAWLRDRFGTWDGETEDIGPRGCRMVTSRPLAVGTLVSLTLRSPLLDEPLEVTGQVVWARIDRAAVAGISFAGGASLPGAVAPSAWFDAVVAAEGRARSEAAGLEIVIEIARPEALDPLVDRLCRRARELLGGGDCAAAELIFRRALVLSPGDAAVEAALRDLAAR